MVVGGRELIDTLWNVNMFGKKADDKIAKELIDTLWNVNASAFALASSAFTRINRYIMECKCKFEWVSR